MLCAQVVSQYNWMTDCYGICSVAMSKVAIMINLIFSKCRRC